MALFAMKVLIAGIVIAFTSWLAGQKPTLAGFIVALPLTSALSILLSYLEYRDMDKINQFAISIVVSVPLSLAFFIPFLLNRWFKMSFSITFCLAIGCVALTYAVHTMILKSR